MFGVNRPGLFSRLDRLVEPASVRHLVPAAFVLTMLTLPMLLFSGLGHGGYGVHVGYTREKA